MSRLNLTARENVALSGTEIDIDRRYDNMCGSHLQSQSTLYNYMSPLLNSRQHAQDEDKRYHIQHIKCYKTECRAGTTAKG